MNFLSLIKQLMLELVGPLKVLQIIKLELNEKLANDGYYVPISKEFEDYNLYEIINKGIKITK